MNFFHSLQIALDNLRANKLRSLLTMLGIIIGVSAVIMMVAILQGASSHITKEFEKFGSNLIIVGYAPDEEERKTQTQHIEGLKNDDVSAIREQCGLIRGLSPEIPMGSPKLKYAGRNMDASGTGVVPDYERMRNVEVVHGRFISDDDERTWAKVCVIGDKVREQLFLKTDPVGQDIELNGLSLTVVGVLAPKGQTFEGDADKQVYVPLTTVQKRIIGSNIVGVVYAEPVDFAHINAAKDEVWQLLMRRYDNLPGWKVDSFDTMIASINQVILIFTLLLGSIAGLALLVGGIGIMNIMLVTVTERTKEIGLRKAIGAKRRDILLQFMIEAATVSGFGGLTGVAIGTGTAYFVGYVTRFIPQLINERTGERGLTMYVPIPVIIGAFLFSALVGMFFGIYPAIRASRLDPIEALRHE